MFDDTLAFYFGLIFFGHAERRQIRQPKLGRGRAYARSLKEWRPPLQDPYDPPCPCGSHHFEDHVFDHTPAQEYFDELVFELQNHWLPSHLRREIIDEIDDLLDLVA